MSKKKSVYLEEDAEQYLKEEKFFSDTSQTLVLNRAIRLHALASNSARAADLLGEKNAQVLAQVLASDHLDAPIPKRAKRG